MPPAARVTDPHVCPAETGPVPHVGGPILPPGAPTVLIDFLPAARQTDMVTCVGPPSTILMGSVGVFINYLPAARMGDPTAHGGIIVMGSPTVMIGEVGTGAPGTGGFSTIVAGLAASIPADQDSSWLSKFGKGLFDSTLAPLSHMIAHPIETVQGLAHAAAHPIQTAQAAGKAIKQTGAGVMAGDPRAAGLAVGTVGMMFIPGAEEAEGVENLARASQVSDRVAQLKAAIPAAQQGRITMAVGVAEDSSGAQSVLIGTSEPGGYLRPGVTLNPGETLVNGTGHAEADIVSHAADNNLNLLDIGATRPVCQNCQSLISPTGANIITPLKGP